MGRYLLRLVRWPQGSWSLTHPLLYASSSILALVTWLISSRQIGVGMGAEASQSGSPFVFPLVRRGKYKASFQRQIRHLKTKPCLWPDSWSQVRKLIRLNSFQSFYLETRFHRGPRPWILHRPQTPNTVPVPPFLPALKSTFILIPGDAVGRQTAIGISTALRWGRWRWTKMFRIIPFLCPSFVSFM